MGRKRLRFGAENIVPIVMSERNVHREFEIETACKSDGLADDFSQFDTGCIAIHRRDDFAVQGHTCRRSPDKFRLLRIRFATNRRVAGAVIGKQHGMGEPVYGAFRYHQLVIVRQFVRQPEGLAATRCKAGKADILEFIAGEAFGVEMRKHSVALVIDADTSGKPLQRE